MRLMFALPFGVLAVPPYLFGMIVLPVIAVGVITGGKACIRTADWLACRALDIVTVEPEPSNW